ncbi:MAG: NAD(P)-dependent dehydrogenase (short-subunit alcohol dehydrogenase family) [Gammaproteobacteria bacterium]|jgi:NAD(P)-dependent dehydrogenase (short-subunit alcohol dehydrogenase family)
MNRLDGKVALISGAARGIGAETARLMIEAGANVVIGDILEERGKETAAALGAGATFARLDVTSEEDWGSAIGLADERFGGLDILVNNAGRFTGLDLEAATLDDWHQLCAVNLTGVFLGTKLCTTALAARGVDSAQGSAIVNLSSVAGIVGSQLDPLYSMTKGGVTLFTKSCALLFGRKGQRIRVNSIHPGVIDTDMGEQTFVARATREGVNDPQVVRASITDTYPIGRIGVPEDIAKGIVFLASDDAGFMTGSGLVVDGGITAQ